MGVGHGAASLAGLRYFSSLTVSTPAACKQAGVVRADAFDPHRSAVLAQLRMRFSSRPVFSARRFRSFGPFAASSRPGSLFSDADRI